MAILPLSQRAALVVALTTLLSRTAHATFLSHAIRASETCPRSVGCTSCPDDWGLVYSPCLVIPKGISKRVQIIVSATYTKDGHLTDLRVVASTHPRLNKAAIETASRWRFVATGRDSESLTTQIAFTSSDAEK
jgi:TonB family protein